MAVDYFSKWVEAKPLAKIDEDKVINFLWKNIYCRVEIPRILVTDNGSQFNGVGVREWCTELKITQRFTYVTHPQANRQVEVTNRTILNGIRTRLEMDGESGLDELEAVLWAYRTSPRVTTRESPFRLVYGADDVLPVEVGIKSNRVLHFDETRNEKLMKENLNTLEEEREVVRLKFEKYKSRIRAAYN